MKEKNGMQLDFADKVFDIPFDRSPVGGRNLAAYRQLKQIISAETYDIVHCNTPVGGVLARLAARKERKRGTKVIYTAHGFHFYRGAPVKNWLLYYPIEKVFSYMTDLLVTINSEDCQFAKKHFSCKVARIHGTGVDAARYTMEGTAEELLLPETVASVEPRILCVGELLPNKNQAMAIRAMRDVVKVFPKATLLIAGNGPEQRNLEEMITRYQLESNVVMLGYCTNLEIYQKQSRLLVSCSRREGLGLNIIEAMLSGNPVVATKNRGHNELVSDGKSGYLVEQDDDTALADRMIQLLANPQSARTMGITGRDIAFAYSAEAVQKELRQIYSFFLRS